MRRCSVFQCAGILLSIVGVLLNPSAFAETEPSRPTEALTSAIASSDVVEFAEQPEAVRTLIEAGLVLARRDLTYLFGSADPAKGGMDCSGFIYYLLQQHGIVQAPRDSSGLYLWARRSGGFRAVLSRKAETSELDEILPGDLLFWVGTYETDKDPPISHTMLYLGTERTTGNRIMLGASDGRTYRGERRNGVSVFDFKMLGKPRGDRPRATFVGYARIPGLRQ